MSVVAYQGEVEFDGSFWDDQGGWRTRWRMVGIPGSLEKANPMKKFTKKRGDRVGTRFQAAFQPVAFGKPYLGEIMLVAWSDSTAGWSATFEHVDTPEFLYGCLRRSKDRVGTRFMLVLAEVDHDENVIDQQQREAVETAQAAGTIAHKLSNRAAMLLKLPMFHEWLKETVADHDWGEGSANAWLKNHIGIESKADLDDARNTRAIAAYKAVVAQFEEWRYGPQKAPF